MAHITLSQLTTVLQRIVSWVTGKFAAKNTHSGRLEYADMPVVVLASMGSELDGTSTQRPMSAGSTYYLPAGQGTGARIMFVDSNGTAVKISDPVSNVIYCNAYTGLLYRWDASESDMLSVGGDGDGLRKVYVGTNDFSSLDALNSAATSGVYQVIGQSSQKIIGILVVSSDNTPFIVTQWLFSALVLSDEFSGSLTGEQYANGRAHIIHRFYNVSNTSYSDVPLNTWGEWKVYGLTLDEMSEFLNAKQDTLTFDNAPTSGSNNPVKSGGIYTALQTLLSNITVGQNGNWYVGETDTGVKAQGPKGNSVVDGDTFEIVNNLVDGGEADALSAEMGLLLKSNIIIVQSNIERLYNKLANMAFWNATDQAAAQPRNLNFNDLQATLTFDLTAVGSGVVVKLNNNSFTNPVSVDTDSTNIITIQAVEDWLLNNDVAIEIGGVSQTLAESGGVYSLEFVASTNLSIAITATATQEWFTLNKDDVSENGDVVRYGMQRGKSMNGTYGYLTGGAINSSDLRPAVICAPAGYPYSTKIIDPVPTDRTGNTNPGKTTASYIATGGKRYLHVKLADSGTTSGYIHQVAVPCYGDAVIGNTQADSNLNATNISGNKGRINYAAPNNGSMQWKIDLSAQAAGITYIKLLLAKYPESTPNAAIYTEDWYSDMTVKYKFTDA